MFGGSKKEKKSDGAGPKLFTSNRASGEVDACVDHLLAHAFDKNDPVRFSIQQSLCEIGRQKPSMVLEKSMNFITRRSAKIEHGHRVEVLKIIAGVLEVSRDSLDDELAEAIIQFACREMVASAEVKTDWQGPASNCLVILSQKYCSSVVTALLRHFKAGVVPHYYIIKTLGDCSVANSVDFTKRMKDVIPRIIPVLGSIKKSPVKWVFAWAMGRFAEAIVNFEANAQDKMDITRSTFSTDMSSAFDVMTSKWLITKEPKVRLTVLETLGHMGSVMDMDAFEERLKILIPTYLEAYKKEKSSEHLPISQGMYATIKTACARTDNVIEPLLTQLLQGLHPLVCKKVDYAIPATAKNHNELLRCFESLARSQTEMTLNFVINRFSLKETPIRIASLVILRHFVNSLNEILQDKKPLIMSSVITFVEETNLDVRKSVLQLIASMANNDYLCLEGGQRLVKFVVEQCALADGGKDPLPGQLRAAGQHMLFVMASRVFTTHQVLWPYLLEMFASRPLRRAYVVLTKSLQILATTKRKEGSEDYNIDFKAEVNIPSKAMLFSRLMIMAGCPFNERDQGMASISLLMAMGPLLNASCASYWDETVPALITHLEQHSEMSLNLSQWQETLLRVFKQSLVVSTDNEFTREVCEALNAQFSLYQGEDDYLRLAYRYQGVVLAKLEVKALIGATLDTLISTVDSSSDLQRQGLAQAMGLCGHAHLDTVLPKLAIIIKPKVAEVKKSSGFFSSFGSSSPKQTGPPDKDKAMVLLCYGYVAAYADSELILSRLDMHVMQNIAPIAKAAQTSSQLIKVGFIKSVDLIGKALHPSRLPESKKAFSLQQRDELVQGILCVLDPSGGKLPNNELRLLGLNALSTLTNLTPSLTPEMLEVVFRIVMPYFGILAKDSGLRDDVGHSPKQKKKGGKGSNADVEESKSEGDHDPLKAPQEMMLVINNLLSSVVNMDPTVTTLLASIKNLNSYMSSPVLDQRERACQTYLMLLKKFVVKLVQEKVSMVETNLPSLGSFLAPHLCRVCDPSAVVRSAAVDNIQAVLYIGQMLGNPDDPKPRHEIKLLTELRNKLDVEEVEKQLPVVADMAALLTAILTTEEVVEAMLQTLQLVETQSDGPALGACGFVKAFLVQKGDQVGEEGTKSVAALVNSISKAVAATGERPDLQDAVLDILRQLATQHFEAVLKTLLSANCPLPESIQKCLKGLVDCGDATMALNTIKYFFTVLNETPLDNNAPTPLVMAATCALTATLDVPFVKPLIAGSYAALYCSLMMRVGTSQGVDSGQSSTDAIEALKVFLKAQGEGKMIVQMEEKQIFANLTTSGYDDAVTGATTLFCGLHGDKKRSVLKFLAKFYSQQSYLGQRVVATALLAEFVNHSGDDILLLKELIKFLLPRVADKIVKVRKQALKGLGNLVEVWSAEVQESASSVLSALTSASEDQESDVAAEAVASLTRIMKVVDEATIGPMLINVCFRMRPAFDRKKAVVRSAAFSLFGALCRFGEGAKGKKHDNLQGLISNFIDQVHTNIIIFIVHLNDDDENVRKSCLEAFKKVADLLSPEILAVFDDFEPEPHTYDEMVTKMAPLLVAAFPGRIRSYVGTSVEYFGSPWTGIRGNAAIIGATLTACSDKDVRRTVNTNSLCSELIKLLGQKEELVRMRTAKAMSILHDV